MPANPSTTDPIRAQLAEGLSALTRHQVKLSSWVQNLEQTSLLPGKMSVAQYTRCSAVFEPFDEQREKFSNYKLRLQNFFDLRGINDNNEARKKMLSHCTGAKHFETLAEYTTPDPPSTNT